MTTEEYEKNTSESKIYSYTENIRKGSDCIRKFKGQPLCDDIGCEVLEEGKYMTKSCKQYAKKYLGYPCNDEVCKGNDCGCSYSKRQLCEDVGRVYNKECRYLTTVKYDKHMTASNGYNCNAAVCKGNDCGCCYKEQSMCEEIDYEDQIEGRCMTKEDCVRYMNDSKGYTCNDELCNGTAYAFKYKEQPLCEDIACEDQTEGRYMTENKCKQYANKYPGYPSNDEFCKGNNCVFIYQEQPLGRDIKYDDQQENICKPKEECEKYMNDSKAFICTDKVCKGNNCAYSSEE